MTRAARIRAWLQTQDGPRTGPEIRAGIGGDPNAGFTIGSMYRDGLLTSTGEARGAAYSIAREPERAERLSDEEARQRKAEREAARRRGQGGMSRAEWLAQCAALREAREAATKARAAARRAVRGAAKRKQKRPAAPKAKAKAPARPKPVKFDTRPAAPEKPAPVAVQSVEDWLAAGNRPEVLKPFAWSRPLRTAP